MIWFNTERLILHCYDLHDIFLIICFIPTLNHVTLNITLNHITLIDD